MTKPSLRLLLHSLLDCTSPDKAGYIASLLVPVMESVECCPRDQLAFVKQANWAICSLVAVNWVVLAVHADHLSFYKA